MPEIHFVTTEDGFILQLHRIAGGPNNPPKKGKKVMLMMHGMLDSSATWVLAGPQNAVLLILFWRVFIQLPLENVIKMKRSI